MKAENAQLGLSRWPMPYASLWTKSPFTKKSTLPTNPPTTLDSRRQMGIVNCHKSNRPGTTTIDLHQPKRKLPEPPWNQ